MILNNMTDFHLCLAIGQVWAMIGVITSPNPKKSLMAAFISIAWGVVGLVLAAIL